MQDISRGGGSKEDESKNAADILIFEIEQNRKVGLFLIPISCRSKIGKYSETIQNSGPGITKS
jgi:hypothetical protein